MIIYNGAYMIISDDYTITLLLILLHIISIIIIDILYRSPLTYDHI